MAMHNGSTREAVAMLLSTPHVVKLTGASRRQLGYWERTALVRPMGKATARRRFYSFPDVVAVQTVVALRRQGCSLQKVRRAVEHLRKHFPATDSSPDVLSRLTLLTDGRKVYIVSDGDAIMEALTRQTVLWVVNVGKLILETRRRAEALPLEWTQPVTVGGYRYHLRVTRDTEAGGYVVQCRELPGAIEQGETVAEAVANGKAAIESVIAFLSKREPGHKGRWVRRRVRPA